MHFAGGLIKSGLRLHRYPTKRYVGRTSTSDGSILLDTNVLLRAAQEEAADHTIATSAISSLAARGEDLVLTPQILIEFWSVATRPNDVNGLGWSVQLVEEEVTRPGS